MKKNYQDKEDQMTHGHRTKKHWQHKLDEEEAEREIKEAYYKEVQDMIRKKIESNRSR